MPTYKLRNGERVPMDEQEETDFLDTRQAAQAVQTRADVRRQFIEQGLDRMGQQIPEIDSIEDVRLMRALWPALQPNATAEIVAVKDLYLYVQDIVSKLPAVSVDILSEIDVASDDPFAGTPVDGGANDPGPWPV